jgi:predicted small metal-binding protein
MPSFRCADTGMSCSFTATADTKEELLKKIAKHASKVHNIHTIDPDLMQRITNAIKV